MKQRKKAGGKPRKAWRRKATATKAARSNKSPTVREETEVARLRRERDEALERQAATSDILRVISQLPTDVQSVFDAIVLTAVRLTGCDLAFFLRCDGAQPRPVLPHRDNWTSHRAFRARTYGSSKSGNDLDIDIMGTQDQFAISNWFGSNPAASLAEITAGDGLKLDSAVSQLVRAMATYSANNPGFDPTTVTQAPADS